MIFEDGQRCVLESADEFDREVAQLSNSDNFISFLESRAKESASTAIDEFAKGLYRADT